MIAENSELLEPEPEYSGGLGGCLPSPQQDNRLIKQAIKHRWPVSDDAKARAIKVTLRNFDDEDGSVVNAAVRNLIAMEGQNMKQEERDDPTPLTIRVSTPADERAAFAGFLRDIAIRRGYSGLDGAITEAVGGAALQAHPDS